MVAAMVSRLAKYCHDKTLCWPCLMAIAQPLVIIYGVLLTTWNTPAYLLHAMPFMCYMCMELWASMPSDCLCIENC